MRMKNVAVAVLLSVLARSSATGTLRGDEQAELTGDLRALLRSVSERNINLRRQAAADLCVALLKTNGVWRDQRTDPFNHRIPSEEGIRMEVNSVRGSKQAPELAIANMCAHCMGMLKLAAWRIPAHSREDSLEKAVINIIKATDDPVVKMVLLIGVASSEGQGGRDVVVEATADSHLGVRKGACYLVEKCTAKAFGPIGNIHIDSAEEDVETAGKRIRGAYERDKMFGMKTR
jgi:hypothetical protein